MWKNPEIRRSSITHFSILNIALIPLIGLLIFLLPLIMNESLADRIEGLQFWAIGVFAVAAFLVAPIMSAHAIWKEIKNRTWSNQRLTLLTPLEMLIGKWIGSTQYLWLISLCAWSVFMVASLFRGLTSISWTIGISMLIASAAVQILSGVIGLIVCRRYQTGRNPSAGVAIVLGCLSSFPLMLLLVDAMSELRIYQIDWWCWSIGAHWVSLGLSLWGLLLSFLWYFYEMKKEMNFPRHFEFRMRVFRLFNLSVLSVLLVALGFCQEMVSAFLVASAIVLTMVYLFSLSFNRNSFLKLRENQLLIANYFLKSAYFWVGVLCLFSCVLEYQTGDAYMASALLFIGITLRDTFVYFFILQNTKVKRPEALWLVYMVCMNLLIAPLSGLIGMSIIGMPIFAIFTLLTEESKFMHSAINFSLGAFMVLIVHLRRKS